MADSVFVYGASGHGKVVMDILESTGEFRIAFVVDDAPGLQGGLMRGSPVIGRDALLARRAAAPAGIVAIGNNATRAEVARWLAEHGFTAARALHPAAVIARDARIGPGTAVMAGVVVNADSVIGEHVILNTGATVDHDCRIGDCVHIAPGCHLCGGVSVGAGTLLGAGTTVIPGVRIGARAVIGAGSTVLKDVPDDARMAGSPCRPVES